MALGLEHMAQEKLGELHLFILNYRWLKGI